MTAKVAGISFLAANIGALELMGVSRKAPTNTGFWQPTGTGIGAVPVMLFPALVMMPFYYISMTHSVPGYLKLRFGEPSRMLSGTRSAGMTLLMGGRAEFC